jgi:hypothetical protein
VPRGGLLGDRLRSDQLPPVARYHRGRGSATNNQDSHYR